MLIIVLFIAVGVGLATGSQIAGTFDLFPSGQSFQSIDHFETTYLDVTNCVAQSSIQKTILECQSVLDKCVIKETCTLDENTTCETQADRCEIDEYGAEVCVPQIRECVDQPDYCFLKTVWEEQPCIDETVTKEINTPVYNPVFDLGKDENGIQYIEFFNVSVAEDFVQHTKINDSNKPLRDVHKKDYYVSNWVIDYDKAAYKENYKDKNGLTKEGWSLPKQTSLVEEALAIIRDCALANKKYDDFQLCIEANGQ